MITRVRLKNWKSHLETELRFDRGTNVLVGMMGAGKSAVLEAITYAFFGTLPDVQSRRIKLDDLIMSRPSQASSAEVEVGFLVDGEEYLVKRVLDRGKGTVLSELKKANGELVEGPSSTRVTEQVQALLKVDYELFERAIYSAQNRLDYFLSLPKQKRMGHIDELLRIDKLEQARKEIGTLARRVGYRLEDKREEIKRLEQDVQLAALPELERELEELEGSKLKLEKRAKELEPKLEEVKAEVEELEKLEQKIRGLDGSFKDLEGRTSALEQQLKELRRELGPVAELGVEELERRAEELERRGLELKRRVEEMELKLEAENTRVGGLRAKRELKLKEMERVKQELESKRGLREELERLNPQQIARSVEGLRARVKSAREELAAQRARIQDLKQASAELEAAGPACPVCESPLPEDKKRGLLKRRRSQLDEYSKRSRELEAELQRLEAELRGGEELQQRVTLMAKECEGVEKLEEEERRLKVELDALEEQLRGSEGRAKEISGGLELARQKAESLNQELNSVKQSLNSLSKLLKLEDEYKQKLSQKLAAQRELWALKRAYDESKAKELRERFLRLREELAGLKGELRGKEQAINDRRRLVDSVREKRDRLRRLNLEVDYHGRAIEELERIKLALERTQAALRRKFIEGVNGVMNTLWEDIYPYRDFKAIRLKVEGEGRSADYVLQLQDRFGNWIPVEGGVSGGERADACLALRIAFAWVLAPSLSWLVLDEPTHNLGAEGIKELANVLRERIQRFIEQVLLVTHEKQLEAAVSGCLYRFSRDKNIDQPTVVERVVEAF